MMAAENNYIINNISVPFADEEVIFPSILLWIFFLVGIVLNVLTILVINSSEKLKRSAFMIIILSLCVSDVTSALISPLFWYRRTLGFIEWKLPNFLCKLYWSADLTTSYVTALHIVFFCCIRYVSICHQQHHIKLRTIKIVIILIWLFCAGIGGIPYALLYGVVEQSKRTGDWNRWPQCTIDPDRIKIAQLYESIALPTCLILPIIIVIILSILLGKTVHKNANAQIGELPQTCKSLAKRRQNRERRALCQLTFIVTSFLVGYAPFVVYQVWSTNDKNATRKVDFWFGFSEYLCLRLSECLNPIFYNLGSNNMRKCTRRYLKEKFCCKKDILDAPSTSSLSIAFNNFKRKFSTTIYSEED